jgi:hypothetical protein
MSQSIAFLGRQPALGLAELESLYGAEVLHPMQGGLVLIDKHHSDINFARLGGAVKLGKVLTTLETTDWKKVVAHLCQSVPEHLEEFPEGKIRLGLNTIGFHVSVNDINRAGLQIKNVIKNAGHSVRVVPNSGPELNSAQTLHNQLTGPTGLEIALIKDGGLTIIVQIKEVQDIDAYAKRDQARPKRDAKVGMLPPKLAQTIINLAVDESPVTSSQSLETGNWKLETSQPQVVLDPFCGTGVILQEALLMGFDAYGTDLEPRMIEYTGENLAWLTSDSSVTGSYKTAVGDATNYQWEPFDSIAGETYLGRPFSHEPDLKVLQEVMQDVDTIHKKFLRNVAAQTKPGFRMCIAVPAWHTKNGVKHLRTLDSLEELGYTRISFVHATNDQLVYHRENQIVGRELVVIIRK